MSEKPKFTTIDEYIATAAPQVQPILAEIRTIVHQAAPGAQEVISYQMPAFRQGRVFFYFAAFKEHIGIYPPVDGDEALMEALKPYRNAKGNLRFPLNQSIPYDLIRRAAESQYRRLAR